MLDADSVRDPTETEWPDCRDPLPAEELRRQEEDQAVDRPRPECLGSHRPASLDEEGGETPCPERPRKRLKRYAPPSRRQEHHLDTAAAERRHCPGARAHGGHDPGRGPASRQHPRASRQQEAWARENDAEGTPPAGQPACEPGIV